MRARMHAFSLPPSISQKEYSPFECISCDHIPFSRVVNGVQKSYSVRGYTGSIIYSDAATDMLWVYPVKAKSDWLSTLEQLDREWGPSANARSVPLKFLKSDFCKELQSHEVTEYLRETFPGILLLSSAPYKHGQNPAERKWQHLKAMHTGAMLQNSTPVRYWCYALQYTAQTYRMLPQTGHTQSRNEEFSGEKSDISKCVPFYSHGWAHISEEEIQAKKRNSGSKKTSTAHAVQCRMLGYADPYEVPDSTGATVWVKNSYTCYNLDTKRIMCRHDCLWNSSEPGALADVLTNTSNEKDQVTTSEEEFDYSLIGMDVKPEPTSHWIDNGADASVVQDVDDSESDDDSEEDEPPVENPKVHHTPKRKRVTHRPGTHHPQDPRPKRAKNPTTKYQEYQKNKADRDLRSLHRKSDKLEQLEKSSKHVSGDQGYTNKSSNATSKSQHDDDDDSDNESESEEIPPSHPEYLPHEEMPKKMMEALCGKEREHWKKAWEFEISVPK